MLMLRKIGLSIAILHVRWQASPFKQKQAIKKAIRQNKQTGMRYRVFFIGGRYRVWQRNDIRHLRNAGLFKCELKPGADFDKIAIYDTIKLNPHVHFNR
jgi:hypothetical protein